MDIQELADYLKDYNRWRRGKHDLAPDPTELGERLDDAVKVLNVLAQLDASSKPENHSNQGG